MYDELLTTAERAARVAGAEARRYFDRAHRVKNKGFRDFVTEADLAAQNAALEVIRARHPQHAILAEEENGGKPDGAEGWPIPDGVTWTVDPIDGTTNYVRHLPQFSVQLHR